MAFEKGRSGNPSKQFTKGKSGNPKGRPKKLPKLDDILADVLGTENADGKTLAEGIITAMANKALKGDVPAGNLLLERAYGKAKAEVHNINDNTNLNLEVPLSKKDIQKISKSLEDEF
jgi:hypothetical protein